MLLDAVVLILREVLEAAVLISVLLVLSLHLRREIQWLWWSIPLAILGTILFASYLDVITDALEGAGQEVTNASLQVLVYCLAVTIGAISLASAPHSTGRRIVLPVLMAAAVTCAAVREGAEIMIFVTGFAAATEHSVPLYAGSAIGAGIGLSLGILLFAGLRAAPLSYSFSSCLILLSMIGAGMVMQSTTLLQQVDWLPTTTPLWDSSTLINEQSVLGELLYAVFGYESTPDVHQVQIYSCCMLFMGLVLLLSWRIGKDHEH